ncbi:MAG TPA: hypothetical protein ENI27_04825 [bacterium]|nr:hypothetical protein [bacterium]
MSSKAYQPPTIEELAEKYKGANICLVAQGPTARRDFSAYSDVERCPGEPFYVWTQNAGWINHPTSSLGFVMDDIKSEIWDVNKRYTREQVESMVREAGIPLITSIAHPEFPPLVEFPLIKAMETLPKVNDSLNLNETINYMIALGIMFKVKRMDFWGADYYSPDGKSIRADKRACCEFWIGMAAMAGIEIRTYVDSDLMRYHLHRPDIEMEGVYGYESDKMPVEILNVLDLDGKGGAKIRIGNG